MNKQVKKKWLKALRSGEYEQAQGQLKEKDKFCCLGVLCDLHAKETAHIWKLEKYLENDIHLPIEVVSWAELSSNSPKYNKNSSHLTDANDRGYSFKQIANIIENQL